MATYYTQLSADDTVEQVIIVSDDYGVDEAKQKWKDNEQP